MTSMNLSRSTDAHVRASVGYVRDQRDLPRPLDGGLQLPLMHGTRARNPPGQDLAALGHEGTEQLDILVVDIVDLVRAELAHLPPPEHRPPLRLLLVGVFLIRTAAAAATATAASLSKWHRYTSIASKRSSSGSSVSDERPSPGCRWGGSPRRTRRRSDSLCRLVRVRPMTFFSSSTRTMMWRTT